MVRNNTEETHGLGAAGADFDPSVYLSHVGEAKNGKNRIGKSIQNRSNSAPPAPCTQKHVPGVPIDAIVYVACDFTGVHHLNLLHHLRHTEVIYTRRLIAHVARGYGYTLDEIGAWVGYSERSSVRKLLGIQPSRDDMDRVRKRLARYLVSGVVL